MAVPDRLPSMARTATSPPARAAAGAARLFGAGAGDGDGENGDDH